MSRIEITFNRKSIEEHRCELTMIYITQLIDDAINGSEVISHFAWTRLLGAVSSLYLLDIINEDTKDNILNTVKKEMNDD